MADTDFDAISKRLDRIEQALFRFGGFGGNPVVDPPPDDFVRLRPDIFQTRLIDLIRLIRPNVDPPPDDIIRFRGDLVSTISRLSRAEVEEQIHKVNAELVRLRSVEQMLNERLANLPG